MLDIEKIEQDGIDFPSYCHYFISEIIDSLEENDITNVGDELTLDIETIYHPYCYDAFALIAKTFERKGYKINIPRYKLKYVDGVKTYAYQWKIKKVSTEDDLPF